MCAHKTEREQGLTAKKRLTQGESANNDPRQVSALTNSTGPFMRSGISAIGSGADPFIAELDLFLLDPSSRWIRMLDLKQKRRLWRRPSQRRNLGEVLR